VVLLFSGVLSATPERERVTILLVADSENQKLLGQVLEELLGRLGVRPEIRSVQSISPIEVVTPPPSPEPALARVFIDTSQKDAAVLYLVDTRWERILVRRVPLSAGMDEVVREELAHIVESSVEALRAGGKIGVAREELKDELGVREPPPAAEPKVETPPRAQTPRPAPKRTSRFRVALGMGWEASLWTSDQIRHGPLARMDIGTAAVGAALHAQYRMPVTKESDPIGLRMESGALGTLGYFRPELAHDLRARLELGASFDLERFEPRVTEGGATSVSNAKTKLGFVARAGAGLDVLAFGQSWLSGIFALELDPDPDDYVIKRGARTETVAEPLRVRPGFSLVLSTPLFGD
jgi:hypothetical protein